MYRFDEQRLAKLDQLREAGVEPYPNGLEVTHSTQDVIRAGGERPQEELEQDPSEFTLSGRLRFKREMGKAGFGRIHDPAGDLQIYVRRDDIGVDAFKAVWKKLDLGDHIWMRGGLMRTRTGELTLKVTELQLYSKCLESLPDKHKGFSDGQQRQRMRYLDLMINADTREVFQRRSAILRGMRTFFEERGFMEVETPMLQVLPGGASARPFVTHHNALGLDLYLRIAPELFLKRLVVGGFERVFEINRNFRNEGISLHHNPEFTMLEFYWAHATFEDLMPLTEELIVGLAQELHGSDQVPYGETVLDFSSPWRRARMDVLIAEATGLEDPWDLEALRARWLQDHPEDADEQLPASVGSWFEWFFDAYVEANLVNPTFVTHYPTEISPLSRASTEEPRVTERFELFIAGREIANGFSELNDPVDQAQRFTDQAQKKGEGDEEAMYFDADYVRALSYGMPPTAGEGIGVDRLVMLLTDQASIREVILFPTLRPERRPEDSGSEEDSQG